MSKAWKTENVILKIKDCWGLQIFLSDADGSVGQKCGIFIYLAQDHYFFYSFI